MKRISTVLAWAAVALLCLLVALNWTTLLAPAALNLVVAQVQAPLGIVMLGVTVVLLLLFLMAFMQSQIASLLETRRLLKEVQKFQDLADKAEASRIEGLRSLIDTEFRQLHARLGAAPAAAVADAATPGEAGFRPRSLKDVLTGRP